MEPPSIRSQLRHRTLEAFRLIYETGSVTRTAEQLGLTQPAVSQLLGGLEKSIGVGLFERGPGKRLVPTSAAGELHMQVCRALDAMTELEAVVKSLGSGARRRLRIGVSPALAAGFAQEAMARLLGRCPDIEIRLESRYASDQGDLLAAGEIDFSMSFRPVYGDRVESEVLIDLPAVVLIRDSHRLANVASPRPQDLVGEPLALTPRGSPLRERVEQIFAAENTPLVVRVESPTEAAIGSFVAEGNSIAITSPYVGRYFASRGVVMRPLAPMIGCPIRLHRRLGAGRSNLADAFCAETVKIGEELAQSLAA
ncbi:MAG: LysR family transcriptional regulator [Alphaproteobacteria bacterium]